MEEQETPDPPAPAREVWCPGCSRQVPVEDPELRVTFSPHGWEVYPDGTVDPSTGDAFMDYEHLACGVWVRMHGNAGWVEELGEYVDSPRNAFIEVQLRGEDVEGPPPTYDDRNVYPFTDSVENDPARWGPTYVTLTEMRKEATRLLLERSAR